MAFDPVQFALKQFVRDIEDTGGINYDRQGNAAPAGAEDWTDLGQTYLDACKALGVQPVVSLADCDNCEAELPAGETACPNCGYDHTSFDQE